MMRRIQFNHISQHMVRDPTLAAFCNKMFGVYSKSYMYLDRFIFVLKVGNHYNLVRKRPLFV